MTAAEFNLPRTEEIRVSFADAEEGLIRVSASMTVNGVVKEKVGHLRSGPLDLESFDRFFGQAVAELRRSLTHRRQA